MLSLLLLLGLNLLLLRRCAEKPSCSSLPRARASKTWRRARRRLLLRISGERRALLLLRARPGQAVCRVLLLLLLLLVWAEAAERGRRGAERRWALWGRACARVSGCE